MTKWVLLLVTAAVLGLGIGWSIRDLFLAGRTETPAAFGNGPLKLDLMLHLSWWACHPSTAGEHDILVVHAPVRVRYELREGDLHLDAQRVEVRGLAVTGIEVPAKFDDSAGGGLSVGRAAAEEIGRARQIATYVASHLPDDAGSPVRAQIDQQLSVALGIEGSTVTWAAGFEVASREPADRPPFGIPACPRREVLIVDGVAYSMPGGALVREGTREAFVAEMGNFDLGSGSAQPAEFREAVSLVEAALHSRQRAQQEASAARESEREAMASIAELDRRREVLEMQYLEAANREDAAQVTALEEQQAQLDRDYERAQARIEDAQQLQISADETEVLARQQAELARDYALGLKRAAVGLTPTQSPHEAAVRGRLYLIEASLE